MASSKKNSASVIVLFTVAVIFFISILVFVRILPDSSVMPKLPDYGMQFNHMNVTVDWNDDRSCKITQDLEVEFLTTSHGIYIDIPVNSGEKVRGISVKTTPNVPYELSYQAGNKIVRAKVGDPDRSFGIHATLNCVVTYDYITPKHPHGADILALMAIGEGWTSPVVSAKVTMNFPAAPDTSADDGLNYGIYIGGKKPADSDTVTWSNGNKTVEIVVGQSLKNVSPHAPAYALAPFSGVEIAYKMPSGTLKNNISLEPIVTAAVGAVLLIAVVLMMVFLGKDKPLTPIVSFYPPRVDGRGGKRHMLPVQMGKIIDGYCSASDVTSLIFYWASEGYITIEERDGETYFCKLKEVKAVTSYEKKMFDKLFVYGTENENGNIEVSLAELSGKFGRTVNQTANAVNEEYKGKFYKRGYSILSAAVSFACAIIGAGFAVLTTLRIGRGFFNLTGVVAVIPVALSAICGSIICRYYFKLNERKRRLIIGLYFAVTVLLSTATLLIVPADAMSLIERIVFAFTLGASSALAPFLTVRTEYYDEQLNSIIGFRNFLRDAEKEKLELLLEDDPQYYYNILPYANVLGVSDIWEEKFKGLTLEPPTYYRSTRMTAFDYLMLHRLSRTVSATLTYVPSSNSGSFSGGGFSGGGSSSGGGFSGGSFGGGGGGRW